MNSQFGYISSNNCPQMSYSVTIGLDNKDDGSRLVIIGSHNDVKGDRTVVIGHRNKIVGDDCIIIGNDLNITESGKTYLGDIELKEFEEKMNVILYSPGGIMAELAKKSFEQNVKNCILNKDEKK